MNHSYSLRNEQGVMIAKLTAADAGVLINSVDGHWRERKTRSGVSNVYQIDRDFAMTLADVKVYLWTGYILCRDV